MQRFFLEYLPAWLFLVIFGFIVIHAPFSVWVGTTYPDVALAVKAWKELAICIVLAIVALDVTLRRRWTQVLRDPIVWLSVLYCALHIIMLGVYPPANNDVVVAGLMIDLRYIVYFALAYVFLQLYPEYRPSFIRIGIVGACIVVGFAALQLVLPKDILATIGYSEATIQPYLTVDKNPDFVRFNSTLRGPNPLGAYAVIALTGAAAWLIGKRWRGISLQQKIGFVVFCLASSIALWVSYSRSAYVGLSVSLFVLFLAAFGYAIKRKQWLISAALVVVLGLGAFAARDTTFFKNVVLHDNPTTGAAIDSNTAHMTSLGDGIAKSLTEPLGTGIGSTGSASLFGDAGSIIENQYLMIAHEAGWMGLGLFLTLFCLVLYRLFRAPWDWLTLTVLASGVGLAVIGFFLPVWADDTVSIIWWGLAAVALAGGIYERTTNKKTA